MKKTMIGGQAVMEGVMMKNRDVYAVAVRKPDKEIEVIKGEYKSLSERNRLLNLPVIRGVIAFGESLYIGMKTLSLSAEFYEEAEEEKEPGKLEKALTGLFGEKLDGLMIGATVAVSIVLAVGIFMILPFWLAHLLKGLISSYVVRTLIEGLIRVGIFLLYLVLITRMEDIKRVFMYHGAEHKTINCLEHGEDLTPENVMHHSRLHRRCGTSFMLVVMIISILVFLLIRTDTLFLRVLLRILLVPVIAGISYEFIRLAGRSSNPLVCQLSRPGMYLQYLTTREPDRDMVEVAIRSVESVMDWKAYLKAMRAGELED